MTSC